ncbi:hypothetical protein [Haliea sp.]|jgi:hypothetical protein|uniref:hypothetical protein n=1 Tax=Haliea sp. TaxID=1932666 RepID=UPI000C5DDF6A|nr:hypothetical protein [Haliea sp.]MAD65687.1 hypothetical protein [Haliea sp.]|tara:strand:+ start:21322 stop:22146 length:825 start_codon:yes stop_codon:yes gene_type:complete
MNRESDLPDVETNDVEKHEKPKSKFNKLHIGVAVFAALIIIVGFLFKSSESSSKVSEGNAKSSEKQSESQSLNDSVLTDLINESSAQPPEEVTSPTSDTSKQPQQTATGSLAESSLTSSEVRKVFSEVIARDLTGVIEKTNDNVAQLGKALKDLQEQQSKLIRALNAMSKNGKNFESKTETKLDSLATELEKIRVGVNKIGGEVKKDNSAFKLIVWGRETYAGEVSVSVSTNDAPKNYKSLSVGDSLSGWRVKDIRSDEVDFVNSDNEVWTEGL